MGINPVTRLAKEYCPSLMWRVAHRLYTSVRRPVRVVRTLEELDAEIARADEAGRVSDDALRAALNSFRFETRVRLPRDPDSPEYRQAQFDLYRTISGRPSYDPAVCEMTPFDLESHRASSFPYTTRSATTIGEQFMAIGFLIRAMALNGTGRILEFGPGWGKTTVEFAQAGHAVTAVDINPPFLQLIQHRCQMLGLPVTTACADMLEYEPDQPVDRVVFYECFHHCSDHVRLVKKFDKMVNEGGRIVFAGEPIREWSPWPWGLRLDGMSAWSIRKFGWLELGFRTDYFRGLLARHGWATEELCSRDVSWQRVFVARRASEMG